MLVTTIAGVVGTGLGGVIGVILNRNSEKAVSLLLSFAAGVMLCIVCMDLLPEALQQDSSFGGVLLVSGTVVAGYAAVHLLNYIIDKRTNPQVQHIDEAHPKTADQLSELIHSDHYDEHKRLHEVSDDKAKSRSQLFVAGLVMAVAIALHNLPEGMVIGASYAKQEGQNLATGSGFVMAIVIGLHNIPEGMSVAVPLAAGGMGKVKASIITALTGAPTILGALLGYFLGTLSPVGLAVALGLASGAMLYVVFGELLPESVLMWKSKAPAMATLAGVLVGMIILFV